LNIIKEYRILKFKLRNKRSKSIWSWRIKKKRHKKQKDFRGIERKRKTHQIIRKSEKNNA
jgi:hypothetical protein